MKKSTKYLILFAGVILLLLLTPLGMHYSAKARLEAYKKQLIASGEKLAPSDLAPTPDAPARERAARLLGAASNLTSVTDFYPGGMKMIKPGRARVAWRQAELMEEVGAAEIFTNVWLLLREARTRDEAELDEIHDILASCNIQFPLDYQAGDAWIPFEHLIVGKRLTRDLGAEGMLNLRDGRTNEAMRSLLSCVAVERTCKDEILMISQLVRDAELSVALEVTWESLQFKGWTDEQLARVQKQWEGVDLLDAAAESLAMERAREPREFSRGRKSPSEMQLPGLEESLQLSLASARYSLAMCIHVADVYCRDWLWSWIWSYDDERLFMEVYQQMIDTTRAAQKGHQILKQLPAGDVEALAFLALTPVDVTAKYRVTTFEGPLAKRFVALSLRSQTEVETVIAAVALERYFLVHHEYPARLDELVPSLVKRVPVDYMDGKASRYRREADGTFLLYSVGANCADDGGDPTPPDKKRPQFLNGRDWVWPRVATDQEANDFAADQAKKAAADEAKRHRAGRRNR
jgi:hypothetical protein